MCIDGGRETWATRERGRYQSYSHALPLSRRTCASAPGQYPLSLIVARCEGPMRSYFSKSKDFGTGLPFRVSCGDAAAFLGGFLRSLFLPLSFWALSFTFVFILFLSFPLLLTVCTLTPSPLTSLSHF
ncbi:hypothetical protein FA13DRAFT_1468277 [Coprinellus micaceus]|uniref:Transmembrane protein n=1 Tax=Coprinellus micaceus TaxID=71717 RepID=A0A4Y7SLF7_COPMI|nr:hypothetical protein FA13DRAFT_1468277 [Coprinellus micaceus]